ncbi:MAG TPA: hypothetical protein VFH12_04605, partial [Pseudoxanthomonas sp.]|nr:hypothetical protein [Pseudoxanthomonas sp.]
VVLALRRRGVVGSVPVRVRALMFSFSLWEKVPGGRMREWLIRVSASWKSGLIPESYRNSRARCMKSRLAETPLQADSPFPHPALRATFSRWEKEKS